MTRRTPNSPDSPANREKDCVSRRRFIQATGIVAATVLLGQLFPSSVLAQDAKTPVRVATYPRKKIATLSELKLDKPVEFLYPDNGPHSVGFIVKLGRRAGGGVGPGQDIVAFNSLCTHQGGLMRGVYNAKHKVAGPCPIHLTTFDLTRHGMVVAGHATESLPQLVLEVDGNDVYATAILGLIYGYPNNLEFV